MREEEGGTEAKGRKCEGDKLMADVPYSIYSS